MINSFMKVIGVITVIAVIVMGCDSVVDSDSNIPETVEVETFQSTSNSSHSTVIVTEDNIGDDWDANVVGDDSGYAFAQEFGAPTGLGDAALLLYTEDDDQARAELGTGVLVPLSDVGSLDYWTYQPAGNPGNAAVAYKMYVTFEGGWTFLIYEPYWQNGTGDPAPVVAQEWQHWENMENGNWWSSRTAGDLDAGFGGPPFYTLADVLELHPDAVVGYIQLGIGSFNPDWTVLADGMTFSGTTYDFDLDQDQDPVAKVDCKDGGWEEAGFRNQGQCIRFVNTGQDSR